MNYTHWPNQRFRGIFKRYFIASSNSLFHEIQVFLTGILDGSREFETSHLHFPQLPQTLQARMKRSVKNDA